MIKTLLDARLLSSEVARGEKSSLCPVCGSANTTLHLDGDDSLSAECVGSSRTLLSHGRILKCCKCGMCFRLFRPSADHLGELYRNADDEMYEAESGNRTKTARRHQRQVQRYFKSPGRLVDVGCASGAFLSLMADKGWTVHGIEPSLSQSARAQKLVGSRAMIHQSTLEDADLPTGVDLVTLWDVLEHVPNPVDFMRRSASLLKQGGLLMLNTPKIDSIVARTLRRRWPLLLAEHLNYWTVGSLKLCGSKAGLELIKTDWRPVSFSANYILHRTSQHNLPGASTAYRFAKELHLPLQFSVPILMGEILAIFRKRD
jgi:SAM-dependent methyltransferase